MILAQAAIQYRNNTEWPVSKQRVSNARTLLQHAPEMVATVIQGIVSLDAAYPTAMLRKEATEDLEKRVAGMRKQFADLMDKVRQNSSGGNRRAGWFGAGPL